MNYKFNPGDIVTLKTTVNLPMTISRKTSTYGVPSYECMWFEGVSLNMEIIPEAALTISNNQTTFIKEEATEYLNFVAVSHFRHSYAIPLKDIEKFRVTSDQTVKSIAQDLIDKESVKELSQFYIGADIVAAKEVTATALLNSMEADPDCHMNSWSTIQKLEYIDDWQEIL